MDFCRVDCPSGAVMGFIANAAALLLLTVACAHGVVLDNRGVRPWDASASAREGVELLDYDPQPNVAATVTSGDVRFTVFTDRLLRIQRGSTSASGEVVFDDRATLAVVNRNTPKPLFTSTVTGTAGCGLIRCAWFVPHA